MNKGPDYERIRAMLSGKQGQPKFAEEEEEQSWISHYMDLAERLIFGRLRLGESQRRLLHFPFSRDAENQSEKPPPKPGNKDEAA